MRLSTVAVLESLLRLAVGKAEFYKESRYFILELPRDFHGHSGPCGRPLQAASLTLIWPQDSFPFKIPLRTAAPQGSSLGNSVWTMGGNCISPVTLDHVPWRPIKYEDAESVNNSFQCSSVLLFEYFKAALWETKNTVADISRQANPQKHHSPGETRVNWFLGTVVTAYPQGRCVPPATLALTTWKLEECPVS